MHTPFTSRVVNIGFWKKYRGGFQAVSTKSRIMRIILTKYIFACYMDIFNEISLKYKAIRMFMNFTNSPYPRMRLELLNL